MKRIKLAVVISTFVGCTAIAGISISGKPGQLDLAIAHANAATLVPVKANSFVQSHITLASITTDMSSSLLDGAKITGEQAMRIVAPLYAHNPPLDSTFALVTTSSEGAPLVTDLDPVAYEQGHGVVTQYPVWIIRASNVVSPASWGPVQSTRPNFTVMYTFVDALTGKILWSIPGYR